MRPVSFSIATVLVPVAALMGATQAAPAEKSTSHPTDLRAVERDFRISIPRHISSGDLVLTVINKGPDDHELVVIRKGRAGIPLRPDGLTVDEETLEKQGLKQRSLEPGAPGKTRQLRLHLEPGRYVLICNMSGHFLAGMATNLVVR